MHFVKPYILKDISSRNCIWRIPETENKIYLTFDDGPIPELTNFVLENLDKFNAKATFFCVGENVKKYPDLFKKILEKGHSVGNHTYNHLDGWKKNADEYSKNIEYGFKHTNSKMFRPPYGHITPWQINKLKNKAYIVLWTVLSYDYDKNITPAKCLQNVLKYTKKGSIIVFHENIKAIPRLKYALPHFLEHFFNKGYTFEALNETALNKALQKNWLNASSDFMSKIIDNFGIPLLSNSKNISL